VCTTGLESSRRVVTAVSFAACTAFSLPIGSAAAPPHRLVSHANWTHPAAGHRLHVTPTAAGRDHASRRPSKALRQAFHSAGTVPFTMTTSIRDSLLNQLKCHAVFASAKPHWNLEAWRPDVGYAGTVEAFCNP
jgi:hypothetical protein